MREPTLGLPCGHGESPCSLPTHQRCDWSRSNGIVTTSHCVGGLQARGERSAEWRDSKLLPIQSREETKPSLILRRPQRNPCPPAYAEECCSHPFSVPVWQLQDRGSLAGDDRLLQTHQWESNWRSVPRRGCCGSEKCRDSRPENMASQVHLY